MKLYLWVQWNFMKERRENTAENNEIEVIHLWKLLFNLLKCHHTLNMHCVRELFFRLCTCPPKWASRKGQHSGLMILISVPSKLNSSNLIFLWQNCEPSKTYWKLSHAILFSIHPASSSPQSTTQRCTHLSISCYPRDDVKQDYIPRHMDLSRHRNLPLSSSRVFTTTSFPSQRLRREGESRMVRQSGTLRTLSSYPVKFIIPSLY